MFLGRPLVADSVEKLHYWRPIGSSRYSSAIDIRGTKALMTDIVARTNQIDHAAFERLLASTLPSVAAGIDDEDRSLLHMEMAAIARATCRAIENGDEESIRQHFEFIDSVFSKAAPDVENAVYASYLENVFLGEERPAFLRARRELPARLIAALWDQEAHWGSLNSPTTGI